jgi:hypothetical protein
MGRCQAGPTPAVEQLRVQCRCLFIPGCSWCSEQIAITRDETPNRCYFPMQHFLGPLGNHPGLDGTLRVSRYAKVATTVTTSVFNLVPYVLT